MKYNVWSTQRPALYHDLSGKQYVAGGTVSKLTLNGKLLDPRGSLPTQVTLDGLNWMEPVRKVFQPKVRTVQGSKGKTYVIKTKPNGKEECSCPGYSFRKTCKHVSA
jgi:hypothetical protein